MSSSIINDINSSSTLFINNVNNQPINIGSAGGLTTIVNGLTLSTGTTLNVGTSSNTSPANIYGKLTIQPGTSNTLTINSTESSNTTIASNSFYTAGGIGITGNSLFSGITNFSNVVNFSSTVNIINGNTLNVGSSGTTSPVNVYGLITGYNGITSATATNNLGATTFSNSINMGGNIINNLGTPISNSDAVTKSYVDNIAQGLSVKQSIQATTTTAGTITNYTISAISIGSGTVTVTTNTTTLMSNQSVVITGSDSTPSIDGTWTITVLSSTQFTISTTTTIAGTAGNVAVGLQVSFNTGSIIDGYTLVTGDRILIKNQTNGIENGIYIVNVSGPPTRSVDLAFGSGASGIYTFTEQGSVNSLGGFVCSNTSLLDIVGTNILTFIRFSGAGQLIAGTNINITDNTINVVNNPTFTGIMNISNTTTSTSVSTGALTISGGIGISNITDAISAINGGTFTTAGGMGITKQLFVGTILTLSQSTGNTLVVSSTSSSNSSILGNSISTLGGIGVTGASYFSNTTASSSNSTCAVVFEGGIGIKNATDATSATNGGTFTTAGGMAIAKQLFIGTILTLSQATGNTLVISSTASSNSIVLSNSISTQGGIGVSGQSYFSNNTISTNTTSGALVIAGGVGIGLALNVGGNISSGGNISATSGSGLITCNDLTVNGVNILPSVNDIIKELSYTNSGALPHTSVSVPSLVVSNGTCRAFKALVSVSITCSSSANNLYQLFELIGIYTNATSSWYFNPEILGGDVTNIVFSIQSTGQIQYTLASIPAGTFLSLKINFKLTSLTQ